MNDELHEPERVATAPGTVLVAPAPEPEKRQWVFYLAVTGLILALLATCAWFISTLIDRNGILSDRVIDQNHEIAQQADEIAKSNETIRQLYGQLLAAGITPNGTGDLYCPAGFRTTSVWLLMSDSATGSLNRKQAVICRPIEK